MDSLHALFLSTTFLKENLKTKNLSIAFGNARIAQLGTTKCGVTVSTSLPQR